MKSECNGCSHLNNPDGGYCYMFKTPPTQLPCAQHDKFSGKRKENVSLIRTRPEILAMMVGSMSKL